ncbi:hypothetical protein [Reinekea blandensis]|uniref:Uncharacterized protein n=1 Tax=Reinekea blandensis MED297 TaxID=314283 RepID=A4BE93_9GAMM|nr:hypothetical protein [Reinekea blandensis]EAR09571.1 hypothetical protein MED297_12607 [Reinekea blandensis MED297]
MTFTKAMIDLAKEIRRRAPSELKPTLKMANPDLFDELGKLFHKTDDAVMKALIREICELAGDPWIDVLTDEDSQGQASVRQYRGITLFEKMTSESSAHHQKSEATPKRIYRGRVVSS